MQQYGRRNRMGGPRIQLDEIRIEPNLAMGQAISQAGAHIAQGVADYRSKKKAAAEGETPEQKKEREMRERQKQLQAAFRGSSVYDK